MNFSPTLLITISILYECFQISCQYNGTEVMNWTKQYNFSNAWQYKFWQNKTHLIQMEKSPIKCVCILLNLIENIWPLVDDMFCVSLAFVYVQAPVLFYMRPFSIGFLSNLYWVLKVNPSFIIFLFIRKTGTDTVTQHFTLLR